jgi:HSP20 family molecular chaperone IbpA
MESSGIPSARSLFALDQWFRMTDQRTLASRGSEMAEKQTSMTPTREDHRLGSSRLLGGNAGPFRALQRFADEMDRMFDDFGLGRRWAAPLWSESGVETWAPDVEVRQKNDELTIRADLPGLKKDEVSVDITDDAVSRTSGVD